MTHAQLRVYRGPGDTAAAAPSSPNQVTTSVSEVMPLLIDAIESRRTWLSDFGDDEITISSDLYEVLLAYRYFRRPSA